MRHILAIILLMLATGASAQTTTYYTADSVATLTYVGKSHRVRLHCDTDLFMSVRATTTQPSNTNLGPATLVGTAGPNQYICVVATWINNDEETDIIFDDIRTWHDVEHHKELFDKFVNYLEKNPEEVRLQVPLNEDLVEMVFRR